jgi:Uma2 family endonuclease
MASTAPVIDRYEPPPDIRHRFSVADYHKMGEANVFTEDDRVELIEGELIDMSPIKSPHAGKVTRLIRLLTKVIGEEAIVAAQNPIVLGDYSEPEPDITVLRPRADFYEGSHPRAGDVLLLIEVSDTSLRYDREVKIPLYARSGIPETWLINLPDQQLEIYLQPGAKGYRQELRPTRQETITLSQFPHVAIRIADLFAT